MNTRVLLRNYVTTDLPEASNFEIEHAPIPTLDDLKEGQCVVKVLYVAIDPFLLRKMKLAHAYAPTFAIGMPIASLTVAEVVASKSERILKGAVVFGFFG